jgi:hypothetical protein
VTDTATTNDTIRRNAMTETSTPERNWAGNYTYRAEKLHRPQTLEELQEIVTKAPSVHALGSRHSFNDIADSSELISLETLTDVGSLPRRSLSTVRPIRSLSVEV